MATATSATPTRKSTVKGSGKSKDEFLSDVKALRERARKHIEEGAMTPGYGLDPEVAVRILNDALATEMVCTLRYRQHAFSAKGINSEPIAQEFLLHSNESSWVVIRIWTRPTLRGVATPNTRLVTPSSR